ncbi:hypothetical protein [Streptomyces sp. NPDC057794]|uniref:hypothetical protein n=1 Tax=Streptomyces sp. NPDC057794 TaxID=3346251 RepID=UPI003675EB18
MSWTRGSFAVLAVCVLLSAGSAGCGSSGAPEDGASASPAGRLLEDRDKEGRPYREVERDHAPDVGIEVQPDAGGGWDVRLTVRNFRFSPAGAPARPVAGRGLAHLYVDGRLVARLRTPEYRLPARLVPRGTHQVTARLYADDGTVWAVDGDPVESTADVTASRSGAGPTPDRTDRRWTRPRAVDVRQEPHARAGDLRVRFPGADAREGMGFPGADAGEGMGFPGSEVRMRVRCSVADFREGVRFPGADTREGMRLSVADAREGMCLSVADAREGMGFPLMDAWTWVRLPAADVRTSVRFPAADARTSARFPASDAREPVPAPVARVPDGVRGRAAGVRQEVRVRDGDARQPSRGRASPDRARGAS